MKPTEKEIKEALENLFYTEPSAFVTGIEWALEWQKTQPLEVFLVRNTETQDLMEVCRTKEAAEKTIDSFKKTYENEFYFTSVII